MNFAFVYPNYVFGGIDSRPPVSAQILQNSGVRITKQSEIGCFAMLQGCEDAPLEVFAFSLPVYDLLCSTEENNSMFLLDDEGNVFVPCSSG